MSNLTDTATIKLVVNGEQATKTLTELENKLAAAKKKLADLKAEGADEEAIVKAAKSVARLERQLERSHSRAEGVRKALEGMDKASPKQLNTALRTMIKQLDGLKHGTKEWEAHAEAIRAVKQRIRELNETLKPQESIWQRLMGWANRWQIMIVSAIAGTSSIFDAIRKSVDAFAEMDQQMADVRKFTGMTAEQVDDLNDELKKIDTRTPREELNKLAQEAGRLGKSSKEDVLGFVRAADKINVALSELGDGASLTLSKLSGLFGQEDIYGTEQSLLKIGSVINELSQNCSASAPYLTNFTERMGSVGEQAGLTLQQIMGFGAVFDTNAQQVESSATALSQIIVRLYRDPAKYARVAGLEIESFSKLMREDANSALILFLETLQKSGGMDVLSPMFKDMGENGARAIAALSTLATHIDQVKAQQEAANEAFRKGTSIDEEFAVQNNTVQASLDKCKNKLNELRIQLGERLAPLMSHILTSGSALIRVMLTFTEFIMQHKVAIISLIVAITAYKVAVDIAIIRTKTWNALCIAGRSAMATWSASVKLGAAAVALFSGNIRKAHLIWNSFARSLKASPVGLFIASLTAMSGVLLSLAINAKRATSESERLALAKNKIADAEKRAEIECAAELSTVKALYNATQDQNLAMDARLKAVEKLQSQYPEYFSDLSKEAILAGDAADAYERLRQNIVNSAKAQARKELFAETESEILKVKRDRDRKVSSALKDVRIPSDQKFLYPDTEMGKQMYLDNESAPEAKFVKDYIDTVTKDAEDKLTQLRKERELLGTAVTNDIINNNKQHTPKGDYIPTHPDEKQDRFAKEKAWREREEADARILYAKGEATYGEHNARMANIAVEYYQKLLDREDVVGDERLKIQADYWEAVNKETVAGNKMMIESETKSYTELVDRLRENHRQRLEVENLSAEERQREDKYYKEVLELAELEYLKNIRDLYVEGSNEWLEAQRNYQAKELAARERHLKDMKELERTYSDLKSKYFGNNQAENDAEFDKQMAALKVVYDREIAAAEGCESEILRIKEAYMAAELELRKRYNQEGAEDSKSAYEKAITGSAEWLNGDGGKALAGALSTVTSSMSSIFSGLSSVIKAETEIQTAKIEKKYERETQLAQGNSYKIAQIEKKKEAEVAKIKNEANRKQFAMQVIQAVAQTAQNALSAYGSAAAIPVVGHVLAPIAAAAAVAAGMIQVTALKKQQQASEAQGYSRGGFTKPGPVDEPAGIVHAGEWVASQKLLASPVARPMIEALDQAQRTNTIGSLRYEDVSRSITANNYVSRIAESENGGALMAAVAARMSQAVDNLTERLDEPFVTVNTITGDNGIKQAQDDYNRLIKNKSPKSKSK